MKEEVKIAWNNHICKIAKQPSFFEQFVPRILDQFGRYYPCRKKVSNLQNEQLRRTT